jgi:hypothetical protein
MSPALETPTMLVCERVLVSVMRSAVELRPWKSNVTVRGSVAALLTVPLACVSSMDFTSTPFGNVKVRHSGLPS